MSTLYPDSREIAHSSISQVVNANSMGHVRSSFDRAKDSEIPDITHSKTQANFDPTDIESNRKFLNRVGIDSRLLIVNSVFCMAAMPKIAEDFERLAHYDHRVAMHRFNRTKDFFMEVIKDPSSPHALDTFAQVKTLHEKLGVDAQDPQFQYVVFALTYRLMDTLHRLDITPPTKGEELAWFKVWREAATLMGATITDDYSEFIEDNKKLEEQYWVEVNPQSKEIAHKLLDRSMSYLSPAIQPLAKRVGLALIDPELAQALELPKLSTLERISVGQVLRNSSLLSKLFQEFAH